MILTALDKAMEVKTRAGGIWHIRYIDSFVILKMHNRYNTQVGAYMDDSESHLGAGDIGNGKEKWRLKVASDQSVTVQSMLETPTGFITNISTSAQ